MKNRGFTIIEALIVVCIIGVIAALLLPLGCAMDAEVTASSGARKAQAKITTDAEGLTVEQRNVRERLAMDNTSGSIKHLYVISAYSGDVLIYSTVRGKVTSSGKRLSPTSVSSTSGGGLPGIRVTVGGSDYRTEEVLQDDGTYGHSIDYLYWWDEQGRYHQHYVSGGQIVHVSDQPLRVSRVVINMSLESDLPAEAAVSPEPAAPAAGEVEHG